MRPSILIILLGAFFLGVPVPDAHATGLISVDPAILRLTMKPGQHWQGQVMVSNDAQRSLSIVPSSVNLEGERGSETVALTQDVTDRLGTLAAWLTASADRFSLAADTDGFLGLSIDVPENASPGHHRGLLLLAVQPKPSGGSALESSAAISVGIDLEVVGQTNHRIGLVDAQAVARAGIKPPVHFAVTARNTGNTLPTLAVHAQVGRLWGDTEDVVMTPAGGSGRIAPGTGMLYEGDWGAGYSFPLGVFRVRMIGRDSSGTYEASTSFLLIPWQALAGLLAALVIPVAGVRFRFHRNRAA